MIPVDLANTPISMTEVIKKLLPTALYYGMTITEFYQCDHAEIMTFIVARKDAEKQTIKTQIMLNKELVDMIGASLNGKRYDVMAAHPDLFADELKPKVRDWKQEKMAILKALNTKN